MKTEESVERLGWQGFEVCVPRDWEPARIEGDERQGSISLDDGVRMRLEVSYRPIPWKMTVERAVKRQLNALARSARKRRVDFGWERGVKVPGLKVRDGEIIHWTAQVQAYELVRICGKCGRMILVRLEGEPQEDLVARVAMVFGSLRCHPQGDTRQWRLLGLGLELPVTFRLSKWSLRAGCTELDWTDGTTELRAARVSLGAKLLRQTLLNEWLERFVGSRLRGYCGAWERTKYRGHAAAQGSWESPLMRRLVSRKLKRHRRVRGWFCETTDKILVFEQAGELSESELFDGRCATLLCHEQT